MKVNGSPNQTATLFRLLSPRRTGSLRILWPADFLPRPAARVALPISFAAVGKNGRFFCRPPRPKSKDLRHHGVVDPVRKKLALKTDHFRHFR